MSLFRTAILLLSLSSLAQAQGRDFVLKPTQAFTLSEDVVGRLDHMAVDEAGHRLFLTALDKGSVEVVDLNTGKTLTAITGLSDPCGVLWMSDLKRLAVTTRRDGRCRFYDADLKPIADLEFNDADNLRYDEKTKQLYVGYGSAIAVIDAEKMTQTADVKLAGHPEGFLWELNGSRMFVNVPTAKHIAVIDRRKNELSTTWPLDGAEYNYPMTLDESRQRLVVGCRKPKLLLVIDTDLGTTVSRHECCGDIDDLWFDAAKRRVYASGGGGCVNTFEFEGNDYAIIETLSTGFNARTSLFVPSTNKLYVAIPFRTRYQKPTIRVFEPQP